MPIIKVKKLSKNAIIPGYASLGAAGADLYACVKTKVVIPAGSTAMIPTGIAMEIPEGFVGLIYARSGMAVKRDLAPANKVGVIDSDYRGEILVALHNHGSMTQIVEPGERIAQMVITPYITANFTEADSLQDTVRGNGGFGSTGK